MSEFGYEDQLKMISESRLVNPPQNIQDASYIKSFEDYKKMYQKSIENPEWFWESIANELDWMEKWDEVITGKLPEFKFFSGGKLNVSYNCVDRHLKTHRRNKAAIIWEGEDGSQQTLTYQMLFDKVNRFANVLKNNGIKKGDVISVYLQNLPETFIALLASLRVGAIYNTVFAGFSPEALRERINNSEAKLLITADVSYRRGKVIPLKESADKALEDAPTIEKVIVFQRGNTDVPMKAGRDVYWHEEMEKADSYFDPEPMEANEPGLLIYTSGTSGKPKGIVHAGGGFLIGTYAYTKYSLDLQDRDIYWNTADIGWLTSHIFVLIGGLALGATTILYEGAIDYPHPGRAYEMIERYRVNKFFSAPTAYRMFVKMGTDLVKKYDLSSLEVFASVGEPLNPEAWEWVYQNLGNSNVAITNTWGQTETGGTPLDGFPGSVPMKPGSCGVPFFAHHLDIVDNEGNPLPDNVPGNLVILTPIPTMVRDVYKDRERYINTYFSQIPGVYFTGDAAVRDNDGHYWVLGRTDDVINVAGHRISTMEMESSLVAYKGVVEAAVIEQPDPIKGTVPIAFVILDPTIEKTDELAEKIKQKVVEDIGTFAKPAQVYLVDSLPRTRSGKIIRRMLRELVTSGSIKGDTTGLEDAEVLDQLMKNMKMG